MDTAQQAHTLFTSGWAPYITAAVALTGVVFKLVSIFSRTLEFHDRNFVRKPIERLRALRRAVAQDPALAAFFDDAIRSEAFRQATRIDTSRTKREFLIDLNKKGMWTRGQLRSVSKFLVFVPGETRPVLKVTRLDRVGAWASAITALTVALAGISYSLLMIATGLPLNVLGGVVTAAVFVTVAVFFATDFVDWLIVKRAQTHLAAEV